MKCFVDTSVDKMFSQSLSITLVLALANQALAVSQAQLLTNSVTATNTLLGWYNKTNGLFETTSWWNAANSITTLAAMTQIDPNLHIVTSQVWNNTFNNAQMYHLHQERNSPDGIGPGNSSSPGSFEPQIRSFNNHNTYHKRPIRSLKEERAILEEWVMQPKGFLNGFYDDEGWWALAWMKVYDVSGNKTHLNAAADIFNDMVTTGYNATCGGIWWSKKRSYNSAISNELFLSVAAHLANRMEDVNKEYFTNWAKKQWDWFQKSGLINKDWNINDGLDSATCKNNDGMVWSYNQGVILGGLAELAKADKANADSYIDSARNIAVAAVRKLSDKDGILHDPKEPNLGNDGFQFKGVFARNLRDLYAVTKDRWIRQFLIRNAEAVWENARNQTSGEMGTVWSGPYYPATASSHSAALDVLVAAAAVA
jgi:predicted alpha-1,6-mannanase (GH76 family)